MSPKTDICPYFDQDNGVTYCSLLSSVCRSREIIGAYDVVVWPCVNPNQGSIPCAIHTEAQKKGYRFDPHSPRVESVIRASDRRPTSWTGPAI